MQPESSQAPLCPPPLQVRCPSHHDATLLCWAREHLPEGDFTTPITLTTAQTKPCHLNHKQQCSRTRERSPAGVTEQEGEKEMGGGAVREGHGHRQLKYSHPSCDLGNTRRQRSKREEQGLKELGLSPALPLTGDSTLGKSPSCILFPYLKDGITTGPYSWGCCKTLSLDVKHEARSTQLELADSCIMKLSFYGRFAFPGH